MVELHTCDLCTGLDKDGGDGVDGLEFVWLAGSGKDVIDVVIVEGNGLDGLDDILFGSLFTGDGVVYGR